MKVELLNFYYWLFALLSIGSGIGLYFILKKCKEKTKKTVLFALLAIGLLFHFLKPLFPPYSVNTEILHRDIWFTNICAANTLLFPFFFFSKNKYIRDYTFYLGMLGGILAIFYPTEVLNRTDVLPEWIDAFRFYFQHNVLWQVPLMMVVFKMHRLSYKRLLALPLVFMGVLAFIVLNQWLQSELGYINQRDGDFFDVNWKNSSMIYGPSDWIGELLSTFCPNFFRYVPVGPYAGQEKYWPLLWLICPIYALVVPLAFGLCMIYEHRTFASDVKKLFVFIKAKMQKKKLRTDAEGTLEAVATDDGHQDAQSPDTPSENG